MVRKEGIEGDGNAGLGLGLGQEYVWSETVRMAEEGRRQMVVGGGKEG